MGTKTGNKKRVIDYKTVQLFRQLKNENKTIREIVEKTGSSTKTVLKYLKEDVTPDSIRIGAIEERLNQLDQQINLLMEAIKANPPARKRSTPSPIPKVTSNDINPDEIGITEATKLLGLRSESHIRTLCRNGIIEARKDKTGWKISKKSLLEYQERIKS